MPYITVITRNFPPLTGGMEKLIFRVFTHLEKDHKCHLIGPKGCETYARRASKTTETNTKSTIFFLSISLLKCIVYHLRHKAPDIFIAGSGLVAPLVVIGAKIFHRKSIIFIHGLDVTTNAKAYQLLFLPFIRRGDLVISNSRNTARIAEQKGIQRSKIVTINPGVDIPDKTVSSEVARKQLDYAGNKILLSVGRIIERKGLLEFINLCLTDLVQEHSNTLLIIVGDEPDKAINKTRTPILENIRHAARHHQLERNIVIKGSVPDEELALYYAAADVFIFPAIEIPGDIEGFGIVAIEAASHGTPTVAFDVGGISDAVAHGVNGYLVPNGQYRKFTSCIQNLMEADMRESSKEYAMKNSWDQYFTRLDRCISSMVTPHTEHPIA